MAHVVINALNVRPGGGLQIIGALLRMFSNRHRYTVLWSDPASATFLIEILADRGHVVLHDPVGDTRNIVLFLWQMRRLGKTLRTLDADVVLSVNHHFPTKNVPQIIYHLNVLRFDRPARAFYNRGEIADRLRDWRARCALRRAQGNVFESQYLMGLAQTVEPDTINAQIVYIGRETFTKPERTTRAPTATLLAITSPQQHKDNPTLLATLATLVHQRPEVDWRLSIAGGARSGVFDDLKTLAESLGIADRINWLGFVTHADLAEIARDCLCIVSTSRVESFCMVALEAMSWGCPAVVADATAMPESVGNAGLLARPGDAEDFAAMVLRLHDDSALRSSLIDRGYERAATMTWEAAASRFEDIIDEVTIPCALTQLERTR